MSEALRFRRPVVAVSLTHQPQWSCVSDSLGRSEFLRPVPSASGGTAAPYRPPLPFKHALFRLFLRNLTSSVSKVPVTSWSGSSCKPPAAAFYCLLSPIYSPSANGPLLPPFAPVRRTKRCQEPFLLIWGRKFDSLGVWDDQSERRRVG